MTQISNLLNPSTFEADLKLQAAVDFPDFNIVKGETLSSYLVKFLERKLEKTGWNGGRIEMITTQMKATETDEEGKPIPGAELAIGFPALLDALKAGGFVTDLSNAIEKISLLGTVMKAACPVAYRTEEVTRKSARDGQPSTYTTLQVWLKGKTPRKGGTKPVAW
jgi:hypothetical protein